MPLKHSQCTHFPKRNCFISIKLSEIRELRMTSKRDQKSQKLPKLNKEYRANFYGTERNPQEVTKVLNMRVPSENRTAKSCLIGVDIALDSSKSLVLLH